MSAVLIHCNVGFDPVDSLGPDPDADTVVPPVKVEVPGVGAAIVKLSEAVVIVSVAAAVISGVLLPFDMVLS